MNFSAYTYLLQEEESFLIDILGINPLTPKI